jgi:tetratricopeptide (TPR) repeat protein/outer membrane lipoprotein-sorting protein
MNDERQQQHDEQQLTDLIRLLGEDAAPADAEQLKSMADSLMSRLPEDSQPGQVPSKTAAPSEESDSGARLTTHYPATGRNSMLFSSRIVVCLTALVLGSLAWFSTGVEQPADAASFEAVLAKVAEAETLQFKISRDGIDADVWVRQPGDVRWQESPQRYHIASGSTLWEVDESTNQVIGRKNPWQSSKAGSVDLLALLGLGGSDSEAVRQAKPVERIQQDGQVLYVYRLDITDKKRNLFVEAIADAKTHELKSIVAWPAGLRKRVGPPIAELRLIAFNAPIDDDKFVVAKSLTEDGRIGKISDAQGVVTIRPVLARRWTPICRQLLMKPGDWVRTDIRGANAVLVSLSNGVKVTVGPGSLVEFIKPDAFRLHGGVLQIVGSHKTDGVKLFEPLGTKHVTVKQKTVMYRAKTNGALESFKKKPLWLAGFEGSAINESIGSLIAKVDGRNVPLSVGYHKVKVEIRDQIARTTIEESFVNSTGGRLEGVFHFPLPQDASIGGFGMWIGGELVEADVVEKQRAREIYETILRERRDPGLLEWTGGNIFKARVFPIEPHSEKRIKIVYTQVLPLRANQFRYSYGLKSEMLQANPLRELSIDVFINSSLPLEEVKSPTHGVRAEMTAHSAHLEFSAQEFTPESDFELVCKLAGRQSDVVMIPHQRGDDGYFLVQLMPPGPKGNWQREIIPDGDPLDILLVCDTSASMDSANRKTQAEFIGTVLASLGPEDTFNLATADVNCNWVFKKSVQASEENVQAARDVLEKTISLGWTDLDRLFASVVKRHQKNSHVIYIGDGVVTAGNSNPQEFAARLKRLYSKKSRSTFHSVSTGSSYESVVLKSIASIGGGSMRQIMGEQTASVVAMELLNEIAQPGLRDLNVEFRGVRVAGLYPETLPNLAAGTQQILIGRYLPDGKAQTGQIVVTGKRGTEDVKFVAEVSFADAEKGNSFIPRLWARQHLDHLLQQGSNQFIKDEIIAMSEEFHIITPYTSLLVLESDADRERFGVKRRFQMRDGERFFADGKNNALYELTQQQMRRASDWRISLRRRILAQLARLGRSVQHVQQVSQFASHARASTARIDSTIMPGLGGWTRGEVDAEHGAANYFFDAWDSAPMLSDTREFERDESELSSLRKNFSELRSLEAFSTEDFDSNGDSLLPLEANKRLQAPAGPQVEGKLGKLRAISADLGRFISPMSELTTVGGQLATGLATGGFGFYDEKSRYRAEPWIGALVPKIGSPTFAIEPKTSGWSKAALALSKSLLRKAALRKLDGGLVLERDGTSTDPRWKRQTGRNGLIELWANDRWLRQHRYSTSPTLIHWCDQDERSVLSRTFQLGRTRKSTAADIERFQLSTGDRSFSPIHHSFAAYTAAVEQAGEDRVRLVLTLPSNEEYRVVFTIDTARNVVLEQGDGKSAAKTVFSDFAEVAGQWWARKIEAFDIKGRQTSSMKQTVRLLNDDDFEKQWNAELKPRQETIMLNVPMDSIRVAETAVEAGQATIAHRLSLLLRADAIQKWDEAFAQLAELEKLAAAQDKTGARWIRFSLSIAARRNEEARQLALKLANQLQKPRSDDYPQAIHIAQKCQQILNANEQLELLEKLKPVYLRVPAYNDGVRSFLESRINSLSAAGRSEEILRLRKDLAVARPWATYLQTQYAQELSTQAGYEAAYAWLQQEIDRKVERPAYELDQLRSSYANLLRQEGRYDRVVEFLDAGIKAEPNQSGLYAQYLSALIFNDQVDQAEATIKQWMQEGITAAQDNAKLKPPVQFKVDAAISLALGQGYNLYYYRVASQWFAPLQEVAQAFLGHKHHFNFASRIMSSNFRNSDEADKVRKDIWELLAKTLDSIPAGRVYTLSGWTVSSKPNHTIAEWRERTAALRKLWSSTKKLGDRQNYASTLIAIYRVHFYGTEYLPFLRARVAHADEPQKPTLRLALLRVLLQQAWTHEIEVEVFGLLSLLSNDEHESERLTIQLTQLLAMIDILEKNRFTTLKKAFEEKAHPENMTRTEYMKKIGEFRLESRTKLAAHVAEQVKKHKGLLAQWLRMEQSFLDMRLSQNLKDTAEFAWKILGAAPKTMKLAEDAKPHETRAHLLDRLLRWRAFTTVSNLAARRSASKKLRQRVLAFCSQGIELGKNDTAFWKNQKYRLLIALDEPQQLEEHLRRWIANDEYVTNWRRLLGILLAEQGQLKEAISLYERIEKDSQLTSSDYSMIADWYLVVDNRERYEKSRVETFKASQEYRINNWIEAKRRPWTQTDQPLPSELDEDVLFAFRALFEKSANPSQYIYQLRNFYRACKDFRLMQMAPDAMIGRTPQQTYGLLQRINDTLLIELREEATADEIMKRLNELRSAGNRTVIDLRALDLFEALIERKSSEVLNQPGPHVKASVAALKRAFEREWADGEERQMAAFLASLGRITQKEIADEQLRQIRTLFERVEAGTDDSLHIGWSYASLLESYSDRNKAITFMETVIRAYERTHPDGWPSHANSPLSGYIGLLESSRRYSEAENELNRLSKLTLTKTQAHWFDQRLHSVFIAALRGGGRVSLGAGQTLYENLLKHLLKSIETRDHNHRYQLTQQVLQVFDAAKSVSLDFRNDFRKYAFSQLPTILERQTNNYYSIIQNTAYRLQELIDHRTALHFLIERGENYPVRLEYSWENFWNRFGYRLAELRGKTSNLGDLEPRLLKMVLAELRYELETRYSRHHTFYYKHNSYYWAAKEQDYRRTAEAVLKERSHSARSVIYVAKYLWNGLRDPHRLRAIEIMFIAHGKGQLADSDIGQLVNWLHEKGKYGESIALLEPLVKSYPNSMHYCCQLITAYSRTARIEQRDTLWTKTDKHFRSGGRWTESNVALFARCANSNSMNRRAIDTFREVIALRRRHTGNHGTRDTTLTYYYRDLAEVYVRVKNTIKAVDAISAAIVSWPNKHYEKTRLLNRLKQAIERSPDLAGFVAHCNAELKRTGQDSPLIRKTLGSVYFAKNEMEKAIEQFKLAVELQPFDIEVHEFLISAYSKTNQDDLAIQQLLTLVDIEKHNLDRFVQLAERMKDDEAQAERAATTIVESAPNEAESHAALAKLRQTQNRWPEAIPHWQRAAELRALEPTNLVELGKAQIHEKDWDGVKKTLDRLTEKKWPSRFSIGSDIQRLRKAVESNLNP